MILGAYERWLSRLPSRREKEAYQLGRRTGRAAGLAKCLEWDRRRLECEARGEPFDEPFPEIESIREV